MNRPIATSNAPNVVMIFPDSMTRNHISCLGGQAVTPNIDSIFHNGMSFTCAVPNSPLCSPARYNILTGRYSSRCNEFEKLYTPDDPVFIRWNVYLTEKEKTIAHTFRENGYKTGLVGKWHLGEGNIDDFGADEISTKQGVMDKLKRNYKISKEYIKKSSGFDYTESLFTNNEEAIPTPPDIHCHHNLPWVTRGAIDFIEQNKEEPFFLMVCPNVPHSPSVLNTLESGSLLTPEGYLESELSVQPTYQNVLKRLDELGLSKDCKTGGKDWLIKDYYARMMWLDDEVGAVLSKLKELNLTDHTIIIINTDHLVDGKMTCYRQFVPLAIQWNHHIKAGINSDILVSHVDIIRTIMDLCNCKLSQDNPMDGKSFAEVLCGKTIDFSNSVYCEVAYSRAIIEKDWGYITYRLPQNIQESIKSENKRLINQEGADSINTLYGAKEIFPNYFDTDQLYYYPEDPNHLHNLIFNNQYSEHKNRLEQKLKEIVKQFPFTYGEFNHQNHHQGELVISRGQGTELYRCCDCGHINFGSVTVCPVCHNKNSHIIRDDMIFYKSEEKRAVELDNHIPSIQVKTDEKGIIIEVKIGKEPHISDNQDFIEFIEFIDFYKDGVFVKRNKPVKSELPVISITVTDDFKRLTCVSKCSSHGYWQRVIEKI